jgi:AcrR family transcriptional regulator
MNVHSPPFSLETDQMPDTLSSPDTRSREILMSIKGVFEQKGFDGASMQDLARAAEMSVGNFYRYFASKDAIIAAMVELDLGEVAEVFSHIRSSKDPRAAFLEAMRHELRQHSEACDGSLWTEIEAASSRRPEIGRIHERMERDVSRYLLETFALIAKRPVEEMAERFSDHARLIIVIFKGTASQAGASPSLIDLTVDFIDSILDRIVAESATPDSSSPTL